jgi:apolipoprotein D and lipocalin family protein
VAKGQYWVLYVSDDYKTAIVGDPSRRYLWLLSRTPTVNGVVREELLSKARQQGYDTTRLIWRATDTQMAKTSN